VAKRKERRRAAFGPLLTRHRLRAGLTQRELARLAGVQYGHVAAVEAGWILWPRPEFVSAVADVLGIPLEDVEEVA
jgi:transcriptional regulator with XRE-family HTH domain